MNVFPLYFSAKTPLKITSCMASSMDPFCQALTEYLGKELGLHTQFINQIPWQERERRFDTGEIDICWICGLPYTWKADHTRPSVELLAAPVTKGSLYQDQPIYFSEILVHASSPFYHFSDLEGASITYNEPRSHSGYNLLRYHLSQCSQTKSYFSEVLESGSHQGSIQLLLSKEIDAAIVDKMVLDLEETNHKEVRQQVRSLHMLGPSPSPPWIVRRNLPSDLKTQISQLLHTLHQSQEGRQMLTLANLKRLDAVTSEDYDTIRYMTQEANAIPHHHTVEEVF